MWIYSFNKVPPYIELVLKWSKIGPNIVPTYCQNGPKIVLYWSQIGPQIGPKMVQEWSQNGPHNISNSYLYISTSER